MSRADIATIAFAFRLLPEPRHRAAPLRMAMGRPLSPPRYRATWTHGGALGQGLSDPKQKKLPCQLFDPLEVPQWHLPVVTGP